MKELTKRQKEILVFISNYIKKNSFPPTFREIADHFKISVKGAYDHVTALRNKNFLAQNGKQSRTMSLVSTANELLEKESAKDEITIPIVGTVAAGIPILSEENWDGSITLHQSMLKRNSTYFALNVRGDSMSGAGIMDGDIAVIEKKNIVNNGEIAVAVVDDAVTLKRFYQKKSEIVLKSENPAFDPIVCKDIRILGRLARIIRYY
ncbi:MAG: transcriptional repressor LexA [Treponema sp.]|nr:transcriptional repressor LexA [Treponema sp.]